MSNKVYITYENSFKGGVTGVYVDKELAKRDASERHDMDYIEEYEIKGCYDGRYDYQIDDRCEHYTRRLDTIRELISCLYQLDGCECGGLAHIVTDDDNFNDGSLDFVLRLCDEEENKDKEEVGLVKLICSELKKLPMPSRALLFSSYYRYFCNNDCDNCPINNGLKFNE